MRRLSYRIRFALIASALAFVSCSSGTAPEDSLSLFVGVQIDRASYDADGYVLLELVPTDQTGQAYVSDEWEISATLDQPGSVPVRTDTTWVQPADPRPLAATILIDDSGSMLRNDPARDRAAAARLFAERFLEANSENLAALADFGWPADSSSIGFTRTRILQNFTADLAEFEAAADDIQAIEGGGSRLYESATEVVRWTSTAVSSTYKRMLVVVTDGAPSEPDYEFREDLFAEAETHDVRIMGIGIGAASNRSEESVDSAVAVVRELSTRTGGVYSGTTSSTELVPVLTALATASTERQLLVLLRLDPPPPSGTELVGTVTVTGERGTASARWTAIAP